MVIIIIAILSTVVVDFIFSTHVDYEISTNLKNDIKAKYIARSGLNLTVGALKTRNFEEFRDLDISFVKIDSKNNWQMMVPSLRVGDGTVSIVVNDERGKINLNTLVNVSTNKIDFQVLRMITELFRFLEIDEEKSELFIASLINWLDRDLRGSQNDQDIRGANSGFYKGLDNHYDIKDGPIDSLNEIKMIEGMDEEFFNLIKDYVTVYPKNKHINFSTASKEVIMAAMKGAEVTSFQTNEENINEQISDELAENIADEIIEKRQKDYVISRKDVRDLIRELDSSVNITAGLSGITLVAGRSDTYSLKVTGTVGRDSPTIKIVEAIVAKGRIGTATNIEILSYKEI